MGRLLRLTDLDTPISRGSVPRARLDYAPLGIHSPFWAKAWQLAQPALFRGVRPDNPASQARGLSASPDPAPPNPVLEASFREPEGPGQIGAPPFLGAQFRAGAGLGPDPGELQPALQLVDRLHPEGATTGG